MEQYIPWLISGGSLLLAYLGFVKGGKKDAAREAEHIAGLRTDIMKANVKLDQICTVSNQTSQDIRGINRSIVEQDKRLTIVERDLQTAFKKIDELRRE